MVLAAPDAPQDLVDAAPGVRPAGHHVVRVGRDPRHEHVEVEFTDQLEALDVGLALAGVEDGRDPSPSFREIVSPVKRRRCLPVSHR